MNKNMKEKMLLLGVNIQTSVLPLSIQSGLESAKTAAMGDLQYIVNKWVVPFILLAIGIGILFIILKIAGLRKQGEDYQVYLNALIICVVCATVVASFPVWGWQMFGIGQTV